MLGRNVAAGTALQRYTGKRGRTTEAQRAGASPVVTCERTTGKTHASTPPSPGGRPRQSSPREVAIVLFRSDCSQKHSFGAVPLTITVSSSAGSPRILVACGAF